jgi:uncharacterized protein
LTRSKRSSSGGKTGTAKRAGGAPAVGETDFASALAGTAEKKVRLELDQLLVELEEQGQRLSRSQKFTEIEKYRELVMAFLDKVVNRLYRISEVPASLGRSPSRVQVILEKVDLNLEALTREVLSGQARPLKILEKVGQIRGMLLDLYK